ncbi:MAG TPA: aminoglycoside phosphotransferase family protein [Ilumatobacteraceae bacterium]|nr:aminoglycoside phosphotransferase family protein [Ilumatobacteraceae bacterium]
MMLPGSAPRAYVDTPVIDHPAAVVAARKAAAIWGLSDPVLMRVGMNAIFSSGPLVMRVSSPSVGARASLELVDVLAGHGLRVPEAARDDVVVSNGLSVTCWQRIEATGEPIDWRAVGAMVRLVHGLDAGELPPSVPLPSPSRLPWWDFDALLERTASVLDDPARRGIEATIEHHHDWQSFDGQVVCHGDVHPGNVMMSADGPVLIDWDLLCWAPPGWDHGPMLTWADRWGGGGFEYEAFAEGYGRSMASDPATLAFAELRLVAATLMRLAAGMTNPAAMAEAELRLRYWRGDPEAPAWTAQ